MINIFASLINSNIPGINEKSISSFKNRFLLDIEDAEIENHLITKINENYNTWFGWFLDKHHDYFE